MTIQTPTSDASPPAGLPDEATLNRLAGEFFARLPGAAGPVGLAAELAAGLTSHQTPAPRRPDASAGAAAPAVATASAPHFVPAQVPLPSPAGVPTPRVSTLSPAVPQLGAGVPHAPAGSSFASGGAPSHGYPAASAAQPSGGGSGLDALARQAHGGAPSSDCVSAQSFGLPGVQDLAQLLSGVPSRHHAVPASAQPGQPQFYFERDRHNAAPGWDAPPSGRPQARQTPQQGYAGFDIHAIRRDFPILAERVNGRQLAWFDNAATTHKPQSVIDRIAYFYAHENSNIHRAAHALAARATDAYEAARQKVADFLGAGSPAEIIFVRGATEAINLVAQTFGQKFIGAGDEILVSQLEHHANIVPWQMLAAQKGAILRVIPVDDSGQILLDEYRKLLSEKTKLVSVTQVSNALGTVTPVAQMIALAHRAGAKVLVDGAQAVSHMSVNVQALDADFYVFSGHKVFGPTGIGVVYGKAALLEQLPPWQGGGNMIADVTFERTVYNPPPSRFEAGTGNIADAVGLGAAIDYMQRVGMHNIASYEHALLDYATDRLRPIRGVRLIGTAHEKASVASFVLAGYQPEEVGRALNREGIAVRSGHHCAQPILRRFGVEATVRPSFAFYNTFDEIDRLIAVLSRLAGARS